VTTEESLVGDGRHDRTLHAGHVGDDDFGIRHVRQDLTRQSRHDSRRRRDDDQFDVG